MGPRKIGVFTIASKNYLPFARVLFESIREVHPEYARYLCLADRIDGYFEPTGEPFEIVPADALEIEQFEDMTIRYDILEFNTALKPFMFRWMFENTDLDSVIYLDPDIFVYSRFGRLEQILREDASVVLTPHTTQPLEDDKAPNDYTLLQSGGFNLGFAAMNRSDESDRFTAWWGRRLQTHCFADFGKHVFTDQKWCDLAPCFLDQLRILKDKTYNVAYWNLAEREVVFRDRQWRVCGGPLVFFHFSGISLSDPEVISRHQNRYDWSQLPHLRPLFSDYRTRLFRKGWHQAQSWPYAYSQTRDGWALPPVVRRLYREHFPRPVTLPEQRVAPMLEAMCNEQSDAIPCDAESPISRLMYFVFESDPESQGAFSLHTRSGRLAFRQWFEANAAAKYSLPASVSRSRTPHAMQREASRNAATEAAHASPLFGNTEATVNSLQADRGDASTDILRQIGTVWVGLDGRVKRTHAPIILGMVARAMRRRRVGGPNET